MNLISGHAGRPAAVARLIITALIASWPVLTPLWAIDIFNTQPAALDIPGINATLKLTATGAPLQATVFGTTTINIQAYFDTGASGVLLSDETAGYLGVQKAMNGATPVTFADVGVGGTETFNVSTPYYIGLAPFNDTINAESPASYTQTFGPIRMQLAAPVELGSQLAGLDVFGMPVFAGKVVVIDPRPADPLLANGTPKDLLELGRMNVNVYNPGEPFNGSTSDPGIPNVAHHLRLSYGNFDRFTTVTPAASAGPTLAHNPFIGPNPVLALDPNPPVDTTPPVTFGKNGATTTGSFLLDTGAAASMISNAKAADLMIRYRAGTEGTAAALLEFFDGIEVPNQFSLDIGGIGGTKHVAGFYLDDLILRTMEGNVANLADPNHLHYHQAPVLVNNISLVDPLSDPLNPTTLTLDGILGMNLLTGSTELIPHPLLGFTFGEMANGAYDWLVFDEPNGILGLALKGEAIAIPQTITVNTGENLVANQFRVHGLTIATGATATVNTNGSNSGVSQVTNLSIAGTGKLDLKNNDLVVKSGSVTRAQVETMVNNGALTGAGILSTSLTALTGLGTAEIGETVYAGSGTYGGLTVTDADTLVKYTYLGDADLSGAVDFDDYAYIDAGYFSGGNRWHQGDFDYNGVVDFDDYAYIDASFIGQGAPLLTAGSNVSAVPEPSTWVWGSLALLSLVGCQLRRRRITT